MSEKNEKKKVVFEFDFDTIEDEMTVNEWIGLQIVNPIVCREFLSRHVSNGEGGVLPPLEGLKVINQMSITDLRNTASEFFQRRNNMIVNPTNGGS